LTGVANKEISQGKLFILSGKVRENEFCKVVGILGEVKFIRIFAGDHPQQGHESEALRYR